MSVRVGLVAVSHSRALAEAAVHLALEMTPQAPPLRVAAGMPDGALGTDAMAVAEAVGAVGDEVSGDGSGVVILTDLGSAVLSAEMALEFLETPVEARIVPAPFVEGLLAAVVAAAGGADLDTVAGEASQALRPKQEQLGAVEFAAGPTGESTADGAASGQRSEEGAEEDGGADAMLGADTPSTAETPLTRDVVLVNPLGLHARPAAQVAALAAGMSAELTVSLHGRTPVAARSPLGLAGLGTRGGDTVTLRAAGPDAEAALDALAELIGSGFGEADGAEADPAEPAVPAQEEGHGLGVSPGRVAGPVARMADPVPAPDPDERVKDRAAEAARIGPAADAVAQDLSARAASGVAGDVLRATAALAADPMVRETAERAVREHGLTAAAAVWAELGAVAETFRAAGGAQAERVTDVLDVRSRWVARLTGAEVPGLPVRAEPYVLVARDLAPADTAGLDPASVLGIVTEEGGPTSHTAILARALGVPAVISPAAAALTDGQSVLLDGTTGELLADPSPEELTGARTTPAARTDASLTGPVATADAHPVAVYANIAGPQDVAAAMSAGAAGVGLFRTEFLFMDRTTAPGEDEQAEVYERVLREVADARGGWPQPTVVLRTLDAGSDKPLAFLAAAGPEPNPALGVRGLRTAVRHEDVLRTQLRAMARAAAAVPGAHVRVMAPMVATTEEAEWFVSLAREAGLGGGVAEVGVMVETPAAALCADGIAEHVDFFSLGTNDLTQYTLAADRESAELADLNTPWQPAVLRLVEATVRGAGGKPVGVCGEAAADPLLARVLVGLGVSSLSMSAAAVPAVGAAVASSELDACRRAALAAVAADSPSQARAEAAAALGE